MSVFAGKQTIMIKIVVRAWDTKTNWNFSKCPFRQVPGVLKVKSNFWAYFKRWFFEFLYGNKSLNKVKKDIFQLTSTRCFDWCINFDVLKRKIIFYMTKIFEICIYLQNIKIYTPIEISRRDELLDVYWTFI